VKSGEKGKIEDTIAIPTQTLGSNGTLASGPATQGASFIIEMTPTILQGQDVDISFSGNQSSPVGKGVGGQPITFTHKIDSRVYLKSGEVAAIASVNNQTVSTTFNRDDPNSGSFQTGQGQTQTRQLFNLMRSKSMSKARGQYVFFVSPIIVDSASEGTEDLKKNFRMTSGSH
jgi:pilus assembly protein CpaC